MALTSLWFIPTLRRNIMAKRNRKKNVDVKAAAAIDDTAVAIVEQPQPKEIVPATVITNKPATLQAQATATGAGYAKLAGRPSKQAVTAVFCTTRHTLRWGQPAGGPGITPEEFCEAGQTDPCRVEVC